MYNEGASTGKFSIWAKLSYIFTIVSGLGLLGGIIEWIAWRSSAMAALSNAVWRMAGAHSASTFHLVMAAVVLIFAGGIVCNIIGASLLGREDKGSMAASVLIAILDIVGALFWTVAGIAVLISGFGAYDSTYKCVAILTGIFGILALAAMALSAVFLFMKAFGEEALEPNVAQNQIPLAGGNPPVMGGGISPMGGGVPPMVGGFTPAGSGPTQKYYEDPAFVKPKQQKKQTPMGRIQITRGVAVGQKGYRFTETNKIIVGKNPQTCNLVVNNPHVSNIHCSVRYQAQKNVYIIKDHSSNGTYVNQMRLAKGVPTEYPAGTVVSLANTDTQIRLG